MRDKCSMVGYWCSKHVHGSMKGKHGDGEVTERQSSKMKDESWIIFHAIEARKTAEKKRERKGGKLLRALFGWCRVE